MFMYILKWFGYIAVGYHIVFHDLPHLWLCVQILYGTLLGVILALKNRK